MTAKTAALLVMLSAPAMAEPSAEEYLRMADENANDPRAAEMLYNAGVLFERGGKIGRAIAVRTRLMETMPKTLLAMKATFQLGRNYQRLYVFDRAAELYELFATRFPGERDASIALSTAMVFRRGLGQYDAAMRDAEAYLKRYGSAPATRKNAAMMQLRLVELDEDAGDVKRQQRDLERYLHDWATVGDASQAVVAQAKLGDVLWRQSCPVAGVNSLCASAVRVPACGGTAPAYQARARSAQAAEAMEHFATASRIDAARTDAATKDAAASYWLADGKLIAADADFEALLRARPAFDFGSAERARQSLAAWHVARAPAVAKLLAKYEAVVQAGDPHFRVAGAARIGQVLVLVAAEARVAAAGADAAVCAAVDAAVGPLEAQAATGFGRCASAVGPAAEWGRLCDTEQRRLAHNDAVTVVPPVLDDVRKLLGPLPSDGERAAYQTRWQDALARNPDDAEALRALGVLMVDDGLRSNDAGKLAQALVQLQRALAVDDTQPSTHIAVAAAYWRLAADKRAKLSLVTLICSLPPQSTDPRCATLSALARR